MKRLMVGLYLIVLASGCSTVKRQGTSNRGDSLAIVSPSLQTTTTLNLGEKQVVKVRYALSSTNKVHIWARPYTNGRRSPEYRAHPSPLYDAGSGTIEGWFYFDKETQVDEIRVEMVPEKASQPLQEARLKIDLRWEGRAGEYPQGGDSAEGPTRQPGAKPERIRPMPSSAMVTMSFKDAPLDAILPFYSKLTGKMVMCQPGVKATVSLQTPKIPARKAIELIELALAENNLFFVAYDATIRVLISGGSVPTFPIPLITDRKKLPKGQQIIRYQMKARHLSARQMHSALAPYLSNAARISVSPDEKTVFITAPAAFVRGLMEILDRIDVPIEPPKKQAADDKRATGKE